MKTVSVNGIDIRSGFISTHKEAEGRSDCFYVWTASHFCHHDLESAWATGRKESTIRTHVKHMFAKHGLSRQIDLVRLVLSLAGVPESRD